MAAVALVPMLTSLGVSAGTAAAIGSAASLLSIGSGVLGAVSAVRSGNAQSAMYKSQAEQSALNSQMESIKGRQEALQIKQQRDQNLASINATYAARGGYSGSGTPAKALEVSRKNASNDLDTAMFNSNMRALSSTQQANNQIAEGRSARTGGYLTAITGLTGRVGQTLIDME